MLSNLDSSAESHSNNTNLGNFVKYEILNEL